MTMAKRIAEDGFKEAGYEYIIIDGKSIQESIL